MTQADHDAHNAARRCVGVVSNLLREEECRDAYDEFYASIRPEMEALAARILREQRRLRGADARAVPEE